MDSRRFAFYPAIDSLDVQSKAEILPVEYVVGWSLEKSTRPLYLLMTMGDLTVA